ncbi:type II toxin-antitoxin system VapC family toxin [Variovorax ginsengisoli]|uniref:Ribonuclease VapC n=1 Tax=Variovorax ginsengisoli TaxID=363844 RepID=A0ABT8SD64_9BURK|nr:type II toxin-antitoxin system VapC family toxin [Variovorax ginsengisoli]MDN8617689.1 type II toxin-antitoxin system VapC family toxin [Variovorax ginsengisoli]MDO1536859.1 type II toxin-antitoxin system VapC family toxin [Variovorax ginsengisoli]
MSTLLDTNVLSELLRATPDPGVLRWFEAQPADTLFVSSITQAEMMLGARLLPAGKRRAALETAVRAMFDEDFGGRILPFDPSAAWVYADIVSARRAAGRPISQLDAQIAAIARHHGVQLATRNVTDFEGCGLLVVDPWKSTSGVGSRLNMPTRPPRPPL